jgi:acid phosphatase type 7
MKIRNILAPAALVLLGMSCYGERTVTTPESQGLVPSSAKGSGSPKVNSVTVAPPSAAIQVGSTVQLTATSKPATVTSFVWASSNTAVATVSSSGLVSGLSAGTSTVTATASGKTGSSVITVSGGPPPAGSVVLYAAGDISDCNNNNDEATAKLLDGTTGTVAILGDNAYESGTATEYNNCYNPTWGRHKSRTMPSAGNHEYNTTGATGYYGYFGAAAGDPAKGYYSYDIGDWHVVVLNSNLLQINTTTQLAWLRSDLTANTKSCTLAYWHHPRFSSGFEHGNDDTQQAFWDVLYELNADVVLNGHDHDYERFAPQTPTGVADNARGIREFVVGTGGRALYHLGTRKANSEVFNPTTYGVLKLTLSAGAYSWEFLPVAGQTFTDTGSGSCH